MKHVPVETGLPNLIALCGYAGAGKDTLADYLVEQYGYERRSFAKPIKDLLNNLFGWTDADWIDRYWKDSKRVFSGIAPVHGRSPRELAQWLGTEVGRNFFYTDIWADNLLNDWTLHVNYAAVGGTLCPRWVVTDLRFPNEADAIHDADGCVLRIDRLGIWPGDHSSELSVDDVDYDCSVINNDGDAAGYLRDSIIALKSFEKLKFHETYPHSG